MRTWNLLILFLLLFGISVPAQLLLVPEATNVVEIDGIIAPDEWDDAISDSSINNLANGVVDGDEDLLGKVAFKWDVNNLYLLFQITDDARSLDSSDGNEFDINTFNDDSIEVYLDIFNTKEGGLDASQGKYQFRFIPLEAGEIERVPLTFPITGFDFAIVGSESYVMEISMPWDTLNVESPKAGDTLGFEVALNDDDDGGGRDGQLFWNSTESDDWQDASKWGNILLTASLDDLKKLQIIENLPTLQLFDVNDQTWVSWTETEGFTYQLEQSHELATWKEDNRELFSTGSFRYFILEASDFEEDTFFHLAVSTVDE